MDGSEDGSAGVSFQIDRLDDLERLALSASNKVITAIESAVAVWNAAGQRPAELKPRIIRLQYLHGSLSIWEQKMLRSLGRGDMTYRVDMLRQFSRIFDSYR